VPFDSGHEALAPGARRKRMHVAGVGGAQGRGVKKRKKEKKSKKKCVGGGHGLPAQGTRHAGDTWAAQSATRRSPRPSPDGEW